MFSPDRIRQLALDPGLHALEAQYPIAAAWRYHEPAQLGPTRALLAFARGEVRDLILRRRPLRAPTPGRWIVFALSDTPATLDTLTPILEEFHRRDREAFFLTSLRTASVASLPIDGQESLSRLRAAVPLGRRPALAIRASRIAQRVADGLNRPLARWSIWLWLYDGFLAAEAASPWIRQAAGLLMDSDISAAQKGLVSAAHDAARPSVVLQHGLLGPSQFPVYADRMFFWGEGFLDEAVTLYGFPRERGAVIGCPRWDVLEEMRRGPRDTATRALLERKAGRPVVLIISNAHVADMYADHYARFFRSVRALLESDLNVAIRLHPNETGLEHYRGSIPSALLHQAHVVPAERGLHETLRSSDVAFHVFSAAALEAMLLEVPVLYEGGGPRPRLTDFPDRGGGQWVCAEDVVRVCGALAGTGQARDEAIRGQGEFLARMLANRGCSAPVAAEALAALEGCRS